MAIGPNAGQLLVRAVFTVSVLTFLIKLKLKLISRVQINMELRSRVKKDVETEQEY